MFVDYLSKLFDFGKLRYGKHFHKPPRKPQNNLNPWETRFVNLQSILIWEKPNKSALTILIANAIYWYLVYSEIQLFFGFSMLGLVSFLHNQWVYYIWPEISVPNINADQEEWTPVHPCVLSAPELSRYLRNCLSYIQEQYIRLAQLRRKQPGYFCAVMVTFFCSLWMLGHFVPGVILLYGLLMGFLCIPGLIINCIPDSVMSRIQELWLLIFSLKQNSDGDGDINEFLPEEALPEMEFDIKKTPDMNVSVPLEPSGQSTKSHSLRGSKKQKKRHISPSRDSIKSGSSFTFGLSDGDFPSLTDTLDDSDEVDLPLSEMPSAETTLITSDISETEIQFLPTHFGSNERGISEHHSSPSDSFTDLAVTKSLTVQDQATFSSSDTPSVMHQLMNLATMENTTAFLSNFGQQVASALSGQNRQDVNNVDLLRRSNFEEDFEMISDDEMQ